jgi:hypothetical protein
MGIYYHLAIFTSLDWLGDGQPLVDTRRAAFAISMCQFDDEEWRRGYVDREETLRIGAPYGATASMIGEHSWAVEFVWSTLGDFSTRLCETRRLPIR